MAIGPVPFQKNIQAFSARRPQAFTSIILFCTSLIIYLMNAQFMSTTDNYPNTLLAFNWLLNHTFTFDAFRESINAGFAPHYFVDSLDGHLSSKYPIGPAIVTFPLYICFFIYLKTVYFFKAIGSDSSTIIDITSRSFETYRMMFEKDAGAIATSFSVVLFYLCSRLKFSQGVSLLSSFIFAFATPNWTISSQGIWQHTMANLVLLTTILCLLKAHRKPEVQPFLLGLAGFFCGLLPGCRPTSLLFVMAIIVYVTYTYQYRSVVFFVGFSSILMSISWNVHFFGWPYALSGGYSAFERVYYRFTFDQFKTGLLGMSISPSKGWLWGCPVILFAIPGAYYVVRKWGERDEKLLVLLGFACGSLFFSYCFYSAWHGAIAYGPARFMTDTLPIICLFIAYSLTSFIGRFTRQFNDDTSSSKTSRLSFKKLGDQLIISILVMFTLMSVFVQIIGAFGEHTHWILIPNSTDDRVWNIHDNSIQRTWNSLASKISPPIRDVDQYVNGFKGEVTRIYWKDKPIRKNRIKVDANRRLKIEADIKNIGTSTWYGYETGMDSDIAVVSVYFYDRKDRELPRQLHKSTLYIAESIASGDSATASGAIQFPKKPGRYRAVFEVNGRRRQSLRRQFDQAYIVNVKVR